MEYLVSKAIFLVNRMLDVYSKNSKAELKEEILKFAVPSGNLVWMHVDNLQEYLELIGKVSALGETESLEQLRRCLEKAVWAQNIFGKAFTIFESADYEPIKEFMQSEDYVSIRDQFITGTMEYWGENIHSCKPGTDETDESGRAVELCIC